MSMLTSIYFASGNSVHKTYGPTDYDNYDNHASENAANDMHSIIFQAQFTPEVIEEVRYADTPGETGEF